MTIIKKGDMMKKKDKYIFTTLILMLVSLLLIMTIRDTKESYDQVANAITQVEKHHRPIQVNGCLISWNKYSKVVETYCAH